MKTIIAGCRDQHYQTFYYYTQLLEAIRKSGFEPTEIVSGKATGFDALGEKYAKQRRLPVTSFPANWSEHGKGAGPIRNQEMSKYADCLILMWDGKSRGSFDMLKKAHAAGLQVYVQMIENPNGSS